MENENASKELDLIDIIKIVWGWFLRFVWEPAVFVFKFVLRRWWIAVLALFAGFGIAFYVSEYFPEYTGTIVYRNNVCESSEFVADVRLMTRTSPDSKVPALGISINDAVKIKAIWAHQLCYTDSDRSSFAIDLADNLAAHGCASVPNLFAVEFIVFDKSVVDTIQSALLSYFNNSEYYSKQNKLRFESGKSSLSVLERECLKLDSVRNSLDGRSLVSEGSVVNGMVTSTVLNPSVMSSEIIRLNNDKTFLENEMKFNSNVVDVVSPVKVNSEPSNFFLVTWKSYVMVCLVLFYALALIIVYRKNISSFIKG
ncbi:MAG: hypothetical protein MJ009_06590 [Paludibacteraceae bacterium]|nr:hypothetical protein [Paludibacteraceae bacterium]